MSRTTSVRKYGKTTRKPREAEALFAQLPGTPVKSEPKPEQRPVLDPQLSLATVPADEVSDLIQQLTTISVYDTTPAKNTIEPRIPQRHRSQEKLTDARSETPQNAPLEETDPQSHHEHDQQEPGAEGESVYDGLRVLTWDDVCPAGDGIEKIAEASFAEVYRITNAHGTSIIKVIRLESPIKPQTKAQERSGLVDEEPHSEEDMQGELRVSEWLADVPGFVVYKERYVVKGKATKALLETHQAFHRRMKRQDPDRLQFYPSPSRYLDDTRFLVVELGDAGTALENFELTSISQVWDIFLHTALALARAEDLIEFEVSLALPVSSSTQTSYLSPTAPRPSRGQPLHPQSPPSKAKTQRRHQHDPIRFLRPRHHHTGLRPLPRDRPRGSFIIITTKPRLTANTITNDASGGSSPRPRKRPHPLPVHPRPAMPRLPANALLPHPRRPLPPAARQQAHDALPALRRDGGTDLVEGVQPVQQRALAGVFVRVPGGEFQGGQGRGELVQEGDERVEDAP
jgi:hypothetical protein